MSADKIILGTVQFGLDYGISNKGGKVALKDAFAVLDLARSRGITRLDTAEAYGDARTVIGEYHQNHKCFGVISKFRYKPAQKLRSELEQSLEQMHITALDCWMYHAASDYLEHPETGELLADAIAQKKILRAGMSIYSGEEMEMAIASPLVSVIQMPFNLLDNFTRRGELLKKAKAAKKEIHVRSVFLQGLFFIPPDELSGKTASLAPQLQRLREISEMCAIPLMELALRYPLSIPGIDALVLGVENAEQLARNLDAASGPLPAEVVNSIHEIHVNDPTLLHPGNWK